MYMCIYIYIYDYTCIYIYIFDYTCIYIYIYDLQKHTTVGHNYYNAVAINDYHGYHAKLPVITIDGHEWYSSH